MKDNLVITIGRQAGSGGKKIGELLAQELGIKCTYFLAATARLSSYSNN